ncbi:MAG: mechanosensitive ion channel family protein [Muribaculaceae bacterium]|nr:mechanosensitive ion channel family protein [Muribaculaceae bacterium]
MTISSIIPLNYVMTFISKGDPVEHVNRAVHHAGAVHENVTEQSTYFIAQTLMKFSDWLLSLIGLERNETLFTWLYIAVVFLFSMVIGYLIKWIIVFILDKLKPIAKSDIYTHLVDKKFFFKVSRIIPALLFLILIQFTLYMHLSIASWLTRLTTIYITIITTLALCSLSDVIWETFDEKENKRKLPLNGIVQVVKLVLWIIATIVIFAILLDKSPGTLLAGLGAFAAVLMLVFKDSIMGIVAGVQLAQNDSLHVGDWISLPNGANGIVDQVTLTDVKIINWDKTVSTIPPYTLISGGFTNYSNMQQSGTRRIQRAYYIDADSVVETTAEMLDAFESLPLVGEWVKKKRAQRATGAEHDVNNPEGLVDGTISTNLGVFRAYLTLWLRQNPMISQTSDLFVTSLAQTPNGIPLQIYCFTSTSKWIPYEGIMAGVFEHIAAVLYKFNLYTAEAATGRDTMIADYLCAGKTPANIFGMPYPFFDNSGTPMHPGIPPQGIYTDNPTITPQFPASNQPVNRSAGSADNSTANSSATK